jgi:hypothetical protein
MMTPVAVMVPAERRMGRVMLHSSSGTCAEMRISACVALTDGCEYQDSPVGKNRIENRRNAEIHDHLGIVSENETKRLWQIPPGCNGW